MSQKINKTEPQGLSHVVRAIGADLEQTQVRLITSANADMLFHYWKVGHFILYLQEKNGWGAKVIHKLSQAIRQQYPDKKGYSARNLTYMCQFAKAYPLEVLMQLGETDKALVNPSVEKVLKQTKALNEIVQQPVALIQSADNLSNEITQQAVAQLWKVSETLSAIYHHDIERIEEIFKRSAVVRTNWASNVILLNSKLPLGERYWYITQAVANGWSRNVLQAQIETNLFARQIEAKKVNHFSVRLPQPQSDLANYLMKDPIFSTSWDRRNRWRSETSSVNWCCTSQSTCWRWVVALPLWHSRSIFRWATKTSMPTLSSTIFNCTHTW